MKPKQRIKEIARGLPKENDIVLLEATGIYLNEEKERVNEVLHEIVSAMHDGQFGTQNCNYLHQMIDEKLV